MFSELSYSPKAGEPGTGLHSHMEVRSGFDFLSIMCYNYL